MSRFDKNSSSKTLKVPAEKLREVLGVGDVNFVAKRHSLAVVDSSLSGAAIQPGPSA